MLKRSNFVYSFLQVITWIIFVGLSIEAGTLIVNFIFSLFKPEVVKNLYEKLDLSQMYERSQWAYFGMYGFILAISISKASLFYEVIRLTYKFDLAKPFNNFVSKQVTKISYFTLSIGLLSVIARQTSENLQKRGFDIDTLNKFWADGQAYIMMAAVIYVIATIISKGVEIQNENDLTI